MAWRPRLLGHWKSNPLAACLFLLQRQLVEAESSHWEASWGLQDSQGANCIPCVCSREGSRGGRPAPVGAVAQV